MILLKYKSDHVTPLLKTLQWFLILGKAKSSWWRIGKESVCNAGDADSIPGLGDPLGEGMATNFTMLAYRIPWTEEPGRLQSTGS